MTAHLSGSSPPPVSRAPLWVRTVTQRAGQGDSWAPGAAAGGTQCTLDSYLENPHGQGPVGYGPWGCGRVDRTEACFACTQGLQAAELRATTASPAPLTWMSWAHWAWPAGSACRKASGRSAPLPPPAGTLTPLQELLQAGAGLDAPSQWKQLKEGPAGGTAGG